MIKVNPDKEYVKSVREAIINNKGYCCCKLEHITENLCPCLEFRESQKCECDLYITVEENT